MFSHGVVAKNKKNLLGTSSKVTKEQRLRLIQKSGIQVCVIYEHQQEYKEMVEIAQNHRIIKVGKDL